MSHLSICYVSAQYLPHVGGVERYTLNLSKELVRQGHSVTIVTSSNVGEPDYCESEGITVFRLPSWQCMNGRYPVLKVNAKVKEIEKQLNSKQFDHVLINTRFYPLSIWGAKFAAKRAIPCTVIEHGAGHLSLGVQFLDVFVHGIEHLLTKMINTYHPHYISVSSAAGEWLKHFKLSSEAVAYNTVDFREIEKLQAQAKISFRKKLQINDNTVLVLYAGRLVKEKGILQLIESVKNLAKRYDVKLCIAGNGNLAGDIRKEKDPVFYVGQLSLEQVITLMSESDIFCLPSDMEGFPTSVLEAAACKTCVATTPFGGTKEIVVDDKCGVLLNQNTVEEITKGLESILDKPSLRKEKEEYLYEYVTTVFTWKRTANTILEQVRKRQI